MNGILYLEDGTVYKGKGFGKKGTSVGELVFNTSITGYQEILTDPSYAGQIITMTYPLIGNYGINSSESESSKIYAKGLVTKSIDQNPSNYMSEYTLEEMLQKMGIVGICDVDTRSITKRIRNEGALKCIISNEDLSMEQLDEILKEKKLKEDWMKIVGTKEVFHIEGKGPKIAVLDFGIKQNILNNLKYRNCDITVFPYDTSYEEIMNSSPDGVLLSNGPGNPKAATEAIETIKKIIKKIPTFGICMGHQVLSLAVGGDTYKMKYGHRGGNHGVYDITRDKAYITSQNHGYAVDRKSVEENGMEITHINLNDNTVEGMRHKELPVFSVQYHPEGAPGPTDSTYLFDKFIDHLKEGDKCL
ncbi:glutamine-hydrolyzing carbamoyl-phosphate synthase small subunit [Marinisporobacter balticus]|uniref:Carbamoyl phosphate synthase small chain n=1 Tax=Marinisporobacter balticus TaxID=2018667 RepID=A0A4R2KC53_9FIRM|nr:glutamine-hydrolyzing carbamoyl-phosphate synthase small subunit [Marinisporobacter balticus]TCO71063.1 carbamoyl-phosphate synthase small subunit [Marinisporobacter balticus]